MGAILASLRGKATVETPTSIQILIQISTIVLNDYGTHI